MQNTGPAPEMALIADVISFTLGGYLFIAFLYYIFRPSTSAATNEAHNVLAKKKKRGHSVTPFACVGQESSCFQVFA